MSREEILPTYKISALVRAPEGQVELAGRCVNRLPLLAGPQAGISVGEISKPQSKPLSKKESFPGICGVRE